MLSKAISQELNKLHKWLAVNKLSLNINKTNYMGFGKGRVASDIAIAINQNIIIIDDKLSWIAHIQSVKSNLPKTMLIIYKTKFFLKALALITLYFSLFLPHIDYCSDIWLNTYRTNLMPLFTLQKRVVRIICGAKARDQINILFINLKFIKLFDLIEYKTSAVLLLFLVEIKNQNTLRSSIIILQS